MAISLPIVSTFDPRGVARAKAALQDFSRVAGDIAKIGATAVAAIGVAGVKEAVQFESSLAKIEGLVGVTGGDLDFLAQRARELGPAFGKSANEAADALFFITSAGLRGDAAINVLEASLKGAAIGLGETKTIADLATSAVNAYGESNLNGAQAVDVLTEAVRLGKLEPEALAQTMGNVLPIASNLGVSFQEVGAAMAGMSKTGTDANTAATQLRQILATIAKPTAEADRALADMGLSAEGLRTQIREKGLFDTLETLTTAFDGNIEATTEVFGNIRALSGVLDLMGASVDDNRELFRLMTDETGVLDEALAVASETAEFKFNEAMAKTKETLLGIGQDLLERLLPYLDQFNTFMEENGPQIQAAFDNIYGAVENVVVKVAEFLDGLQARPEFQEFLENVKGMFDEIDGSTQNVIDTILDLSENAIVLLIDTINENFSTLEDLASILDDISFFANEIIDGFDGMTTETDNVVQTFIDSLHPLGRARDALSAIADAINAVRSAYEKLKGKTGLDFKFREDFVRNPYIQPRAVGGSVMGGSAYLVGERGPELFIPSSGGQIMAAGRTAGMGQTTNYNITVQAGVGDPVTIGREVVTAIKRYERANGPVFASA